MNDVKRWVMAVGLLCLIGGSQAGCGGSGFAAAPKNEQVKQFEGRAPSGASAAKYQAAMRAAQSGGPRR